MKRFIKNNKSWLFPVLAILVVALASGKAISDTANETAKKSARDTAIAISKESRKAQYAGCLRGQEDRKVNAHRDVTSSNANYEVSRDPKVPTGVQTTKRIEAFAQADAAKSELSRTNTPATPELRRLYNQLGLAFYPGPPFKCQRIKT